MSRRMSNPIEALDKKLPQPMFFSQSEEEKFRNKGGMGNVAFFFALGIALIVTAFIVSGSMMTMSVALGGVFSIGFGFHTVFPESDGVKSKRIRKELTGAIEEAAMITLSSGSEAPDEDILYSTIDKRLGNSSIHPDDFDVDNMSAKQVDWVQKTWFKEIEVQTKETFEQELGSHGKWWIAEDTAYKLSQVVKDNDVKRNRYKIQALKELRDTGKVSEQYIQS